MNTFRILALDGGGIKGAFTAAVLAAWEKDTNLQVQDHFDLITGTSTGGILAIGLGLGLSGEKMLDFYKERGPAIFPITGFGRNLLRKVRQMQHRYHVCGGFGQGIGGGRVFGWGPRVVSLIMNAQVEATLRQAMLLVGRDRFFRVDCVTRPGEYSLDSAGEVRALAGLGRGKAVEKEVLETVRRRFLNGVEAVPFRPEVWP